MFDIFMITISILFICILVLDWRLEGKGGEPVFPAGILRVTVIFMLSLDLLTNAVELL